MMFPEDLKEGGRRCEPGRDVLALHAAVSAATFMTVGAKRAMRRYSSAIDAFV
jgi:hypothetical protein